MGANSITRLWENKTFKMLLFAPGIIVCFVYFGVMQEKIMRGCFGGEVVNGKCVNGDKYEYELTLVGIFAIWYAILARIVLQIKSPETDQTHQGWYATAALTYLSSMVCGNMALRWITYPTQVIAKSSKPIPVMLLGVLLAQKRYTLQKYLVVLTIVAGVIMFVYKDGKSVDRESNDYIGLILIGLSLFCDGLLGAIQDRMRAKTNLSTFSFMFFINFYSAILLAIAAVLTGEIHPFYEFTLKYPDIYAKITSAALIGSLGQIFIYMMISEFGSLSCSLVTTTRKLFTVLISVLFIGNPLSSRQMFATTLVFATLFLDVLLKKLSKKKSPVPEVQGENLDLEKNGKICDENDSANVKIFT